MSTSSQMGTTGIFAKLVAKYLVAWVKRTLDDDSGPALSATPQTVTGRPERDRSNEGLGAHNGSTGTRAVAPQAQASALQGGTYGQHRGVTTQTATSTQATYDPSDVESRLAAMWQPDERANRAQLLRGADGETLRSAGMNQRQVAQAGNGYVPAGWQLEKVPASEGDAAQYRLTQTTAQSQCNCNAANDTIFTMRFGDVTLISLPVGGAQVTILLGGAAAQVR